MHDNLLSILGIYLTETTRRDDADFFFRVLGKVQSCPDEWHKLFVLICHIPAKLLRLFMWLPLTRTAVQTHAADYNPIVTARFSKVYPCFLSLSSLCREQ